MQDEEMATRESSAPRFADTWQRVQGLLLSVDDVNAFLIELAAMGAVVVHAAAACGITTRYDGRPISAASSDQLAARLDETQYAGGDGPCLRAMATGRPVDVTDAATETRWPRFMAYARQQGLRCSLSIPLVVQRASVGAMNFYATKGPTAFDHEQRTAATIFAAQASGALQLMSRNLRNVELVQQLEQALGSRSVIDQAMGIVMGREGCTADEAFAQLRERSQREQLRLRDLAAEVIIDATGAPPGAGSTFRRR